jgi:hypothetical protein
VREQRGFRGVAADRREGNQLVEGVGKGRDG